MVKIQGDISLHSLIHQFKHGFAAISSNSQWVSASGFNLSVASLLGFAGLFFALREGNIKNLATLTWSSSDTRDTLSDKFRLVPGLQNLGNNCFLNVILQALASCSCFPSFLQNMLEEFEYLSVEERVESMPLAVSLETLLQELRTLRHGREVLSPRRVMLAIDHYIHNFNLTCQQDAEEAFFHILSSLREELSECFVPNQNSLGDVSTLANCRIITLERRAAQSEHERWQRSFLGPFDGILGSILTCQSCSFQISLDFQFFHSLHLSPVLSGGCTIMAGCSVEDCLKQFCAAELLENYRCSNCWHIAAIKFLSLIEGNETDIEELKNCSKQDSCDCKNLSRLGSLPWSNGFSHTFKELHIARSPKILCLHIQRASVNVFGDLVKLQGHLSFPLTLNLSQYMNSGVGIKNYKESLPSGLKAQYQQSFTYSNHLSTRMLNGIRGQMGNNNFSAPVVADEFTQSAIGVSANTNSQAFQGEPNIPIQSNDKVGGTCRTAPSEDHMYRLVSVVQHFGRAGSGHYMVYRRARAEANPNGSLGESSSHWFCISDSDVYSVAEKDVLAAEASLLFYEKIVPLYL
ncbi:hypothetical protein LguiA_003868 [Lonicera macranthoides]